MFIIIFLDSSEFAFSGAAFFVVIPIMVLNLASIFLLRFVSDEIKLIPLPMALRLTIVTGVAYYSILLARLFADFPSAVPSELNFGLKHPTLEENQAFAGDDFNTIAHFFEGFVVLFGFPVFRRLVVKINWIGSNASRRKAGKQCCLCVLILCSYHMICSCHFVLL